jgi:hypothetical protein
METINTSTESVSIADEITSKIATLEAQISTLTRTLASARAQVNDLYTSINDDIVENEWDEETSISLADVSEYLNNAFGNGLTFQKEYEAVVRFEVEAVVRYMAKDDDDANSTAQSIELSVSDDDIEHYGDAEIVSVLVEDARIRSVETTR